jgi:hypothetical protein
MLRRLADRSGQWHTLEAVMGTRGRRPLAAGSIALVALFLLGSLVSAGTRWGTAFSTTGSRKAIDPAIARAVGAEAVPLSGGLAAPKSDGGCVPAGCTGLSLVGTGSVTGLGNATGGEIQMTVVAEPIVVCVNPGGTVVPGVNKTPIVLTGQDPFNPDEVIGRNGKLAFQVATPTDQIGAPLPGPATRYGCPSDTWTATATQYHFVSATMCAFQLDKHGALQEIGCSKTYRF